MATSIDLNGRISARRLVSLTLVLAPVVLIAIVATLWLQARIAEWVYWKAMLICLIALEAAYVATATAAVVSTIVMSIFLSRARKGRGTRLILARGLLLSVSLLIGLASAEAISAFWSMRSQQDSAMPVGGLTKYPPVFTGKHMPEVGRPFEAPTRFSDPADDRDIDIVIVGESSAEGVPFNEWLSIGQIIVWQLRDILPQRPTRLKVLAMSGETLESQQSMLTHLDRRPDVMVIYCGHNEITARLDANRDISYYFDDELPTTWSILVERLEAMSPLCGLIRRSADKCRIAIPPPRNGNRRLVDAPAFTSTEYTTLLVDFRRRLEAFVSYAERVGALPILILPPANDSGYEPNRSYLPAATPKSLRDAFAREFLAIRSKEAADPAAALAGYRALIARQPGFAEAHYRLARLLEQTGAWEEAYREYVAARDLDGYPMRCLTEFQDAYRDVARRHGCVLIDGQSYFHAIGRHGLLDDELFQDGMHPSLRGQIALAQATIQALQARCALGWPKDRSVSPIDPAQCVKYFGLVSAVWQRICLWGIMFYDLTSPIRYDPSHRLELKRRYANAAERLKAGESPEALGLPNFGTPRPVPVIPASALDGSPRGVASRGSSR